MQEHHGIEGLTGRDPIGAAITIGRKGPSGAPIETDRFFIVMPVDTLVGQHRVRPLHPSFVAFNEADPKHRQSIRGNLVHASQSDCMDYNLRAQVLSPLSKWPAHPQKRPACSGDGKRATRFFGFADDGSEDWREIECPNERCEFRIGAKKLCKPFARFLFRPHWESNKLPTPLMKLTTGSWHSVSALVGFFDYVSEQARNLGMESFSLFGLPFVLTLSTKTKPQDKQRFPVLSISPEVDLVQFFLSQRDTADRLGGGSSPRLLAASLADDTDEDAASDLALINPGHAIAKPAASDMDEAIDAEPVDDERPAGLLTHAAIRRITTAAEAKGLDLVAVGKLTGGAVAEAPAGAEMEILKAISESKKRT